MFGSRITAGRDRVSERFRRHRIEDAERKIAIGHRDMLAAAVVAHRAGAGARAAGAD